MSARCQSSSLLACDTRASTTRRCTSRWTRQRSCSPRQWRAATRRRVPRPPALEASASGRARAQVFLDVVESVNLLVNSNGTVVRSEVVGALKMRTYLSGMPECKLGLNDKARPPPLTAPSTAFL